MKSLSVARLYKALAAGLCLVSCSDLAQAALYTDAEHLPSAAYDFVVVGGTSGTFVVKMLLVADHGLQREPQAMLSPHA